MKTLKRSNGIWYANSKPYASLHDAVAALRS